MAARKTFPIGLLMMLMIMALAVLGVGYAWWTEQLTADGTIQTGNIDVKWQSLSINEDDPLDVGSCTVTIPVDGKTMQIALENAYPGYACSFQFSLRNFGSVPAKITSVRLPESSAEFTITPSGELINREGLNPSLPKSGGVRIIVRESADQESDYTFDFQVDVAQGNAP